MHRVTAAVICLLLGVGYACFALAVSIRFDADGAEMGRDLVWWAIGVSIVLFTSIGALRFVRKQRAFAVAHLGLVRAWLAAGSLGGIGYGGAFAVVIVAGIRDAGLGFAGGSKRLTVFLLGVAVLVLAFGVVLAFRALQRRASLRAWIDRGAETPLAG